MWVLDVVSIATPQEFHYDNVLDVVDLTADPDVIWCEKPIATTVADADEMVAACDAAGIELILNHNRRFTRARRRFRVELDDGLLGELETVHQVGRHIVAWSGDATARKLLVSIYHMVDREEV